MAKKIKTFGPSIYSPLTKEYRDVWGPQKFDTSCVISYNDAEEKSPKAINLCFKSELDQSY